MASDLPAEFALIARHFRPLAGPGALDLRDDAAVLTPPAGRELVLTADAMVAGVHFLPDDPPDLVGRKLLRVNLSDLAAKGATPLGYLMTVSTPRRHAGRLVRRLRRRPGAGPARVRRHAAGRRYHLDARADLAVADHHRPCRTRPGGASRRRQPGRRHLGHRHDRRRRAGPRGGARRDRRSRPATCCRRYRLPQPRVGLAIAGIASAGMDVSDGLVQDLGHICRASSVGAEIDAALVPLSRRGTRGRPGLAGDLPDRRRRLRTAAGRPAGARSRAAARPRCAAGMAVTRIGRFRSGRAAVMVRGPDGMPMALPTGGWSHF